MSSSQEGVGEMQGWGDSHWSMRMWPHEPLSCLLALLLSSGLVGAGSILWSGCHRDHL